MICCDDYYYFHSPVAFVCATEHTNLEAMSKELLTTQNFFCNFISSFLTPKIHHVVPLFVEINNHVPLINLMEN
jgi:hypothetical protein